MGLLARPRRLAVALATAAAAAGVRLVVQSGNGSSPLAVALEAVVSAEAAAAAAAPPPPPPPRVFHLVGDAAHSALLPRCAAVLHHGGCGTFAAAAAAGVPQLVVPFCYDQHARAESVEVL